MEVEIIFKIAAIGILTALISVLLKKSDVIQGLFDLTALYEYY